MNCANCNTKLSCSCQVRTTSDNKRACTKCISVYETNLSKIKNIDTGQRTYSKVYLKK